MQNIGNQIRYYAEWMSCFNGNTSLPEAEPGILSIKDGARHEVIVNLVKNAIKMIVDANEAVDLKLSLSLRVDLHSMVGDFCRQEVWRALYNNVHTFIDTSSQIGVGTKKKADPCGKIRVQREFDKVFFDYAETDPLFLLEMLSCEKRLSSTQMRAVEHVLHTLVYERNMLVDTFNYVSAVLFEDFIVKKIMEIGGKFVIKKNFVRFDWKSIAPKSSGAIRVASLYEESVKSGICLNETFRKLNASLDEADQEAIRVYKLLAFYRVMCMSQAAQDMWLSMDPKKGRFFVFTQEMEQQTHQLAKRLHIKGSRATAHVHKRFVYSFGDPRKRERLKDINEGTDLFDETLGIVKGFDNDLGEYESQMEKTNALYAICYEKYMQQRSEDRIYSPQLQKFYVSQLPSPDEFKAMVMPFRPLYGFPETVSDESLMEIVQEDDDEFYKKLLPLYIPCERHQTEGLNRLFHRSGKPRTYQEEGDINKEDARSNVIVGQRNREKEEVSRSFLPPLPKSVSTNSRNKTTHGKRYSLPKGSKKDNESDVEGARRSMEAMTLITPSHKSTRYVVSKIKKAVRVPVFCRITFPLHRRVLDCVTRITQKSLDEVFHGYPLLVTEQIISHGEEGTWTVHGRKDRHYSCLGSVTRYGRGEDPIVGCFTEAFTTDGNEKLGLHYHHCFISQPPEILIERYRQQGRYFSDEQIEVPENTQLSTNVHFKSGALKITVTPASIKFDDTNRKILYTLTFTRGVKKNWVFKNVETSVPGDYAVCLKT